MRQRRRPEQLLIPEAEADMSHMTAYAPGWVMAETPLLGHPMGAAPYRHTSTGPWRAQADVQGMTQHCDASTTGRGFLSFVMLRAPNWPLQRWPAWRAYWMLCVCLCLGAPRYQLDNQSSRPHCCCVCRLATRASVGRTGGGRGAAAAAKACAAVLGFLLAAFASSPASSSSSCCACWSTNARRAAYSRCSAASWCRCSSRLRDSASISCNSTTSACQHDPRSKSATVRASKQGTNTLLLSCPPVSTRPSPLLQGASASRSIPLLGILVSRLHDCV